MRWKWILKKIKNNHHEGKDEGKCHLGGSISEEKSEESVETDHQKSINCHANKL